MMTWLYVPAQCLPIVELCRRQEASWCSDSPPQTLQKSLQASASEADDYLLFHYNDHDCCSWYVWRHNRLRHLSKEAPSHTIILRSQALWPKVCAHPWMRIRVGERVGAEPLEGLIVALDPNGRNSELRGFIGRYSSVITAVSGRPGAHRGEQVQFRTRALTSLI